MRYFFLFVLCLMAIAFKLSRENSDSLAESAIEDEAILSSPVAMKKIDLQKISVPESVSSDTHAESESNPEAITNNDYGNEVDQPNNELMDAKFTGDGQDMNRPEMNINAQAEALELLKARKK